MIKIENLHYQYPDKTLALRGINLTILDGEFLLICGPNGSGKTTLVRHINGLLKPLCGEVLVDGLDVKSADRQVRERVGMIFQNPDSQILGETVEEDVAFGPENMGLDPGEVRRRVYSALEKVGMHHLASKLCHQLSGGEKRRLAVAGVLAMEPKAIIFDEPFANLDYSGVRQVLQWMLSCHKMGHTLIVTTHDVEKVIAHVDRVAILDQGELKACGSPESILPELEKYRIRPPCFHLMGGRVISWLSD